MTTRPLAVTPADDYDVVLARLAHMFDHYRDRMVVSEIDANATASDTIDIVLYDSFAQPESDHHEIAELVRNPEPDTSWSTPGISSPSVLSIPIEDASPHRRCASVLSTRRQPHVRAFFQSAVDILGAGSHGALLPGGEPARSAAPFPSRGSSRPDGRIDHEDLRLQHAQLE